jgi:glycosyltransferase involved in cell wall biosynthesis
MTPTPRALPRLAVVLSHPTQYYSPWFRWLRAHTALEFRVFYLWEFGVTAQTDPHFRTTVKWDVDLLSGYDHEFVPNAARRPGTGHFWGLRNPTLTARLAAWQPAAVLLFGYAYASHLRVVAWARRHGVPLVFRGDSHLLGRPAPGWLTARLLETLYAQFRAVTFVGQANRGYFRTLGVPESRLFFAPHSVDASLFDPASAATQHAAAGLRAQLGLAPDTRVVLFAGKLVAAKQPRELLDRHGDDVGHRQGPVGLGDRGGAHRGACAEGDPEHQPNRRPPD